MRNEMNKKQWQKISPIIDRALSIEDADEREAYLRNACVSGQLYQQVIRFLDSIEKADEEGFME